LEGSCRGLVLRNYPVIRLEGLRKVSKKSQSGFQVSGPGLVPGTYRIRSRNVNHSKWSYLPSINRYRTKLETYSMLVYFLISIDHLTLLLFTKKIHCRPQIKFQSRRPHNILATFQMVFASYTIDNRLRIIH
jgi:hypothetical protein